MVEEKLIKMVTQLAVEATMDYLEKQKKSKQDRRLRNIKLLLKNYRSFREHIQEYVPTTEMKEDLVEDIDREELAVEAIKKSKHRTYIMVRFIDTMLDVYRIMCEQSGKDEDIRRYKIIYELYVSPERKTIKEIADSHHVENRTVYRDINEAAKTLSVLMFGVDGIRTGA